MDKELHKGEVLSKEEIMDNRSNAYDFLEILPKITLINPLMKKY